MLVRWLAGVTIREAYRTESAHDNLRAAVFLALNEMRKIMSREKMFLPPAALQRLEYYNFMYHNSLSALAQEASEAGKKLWKIRPKGHQNHVRKCMFFFFFSRIFFFVPDVPVFFAFRGLKDRAAKA